MQYADLRNALVTWKGGRSEVKAAESLGVAPNTLGNWIDGASLPPSTRLPSLAAALGMPLADLSALVARERSARLRRRRRAAGGVVAHGASSCPQHGKRAARRPGQKVAAVSGKAGGVKP